MEAIWLVEPRSEVSAMPVYTPGRSIDSVAREVGASDIVKLASNESLWGPSERVLAAARKSLDRLNYYPEMTPGALVDALAQHSGFTEEHILVGNGADELLRLVAMAYVSPGDRVLYPIPSFSAYAYGARLMGGHQVPVPLSVDGHADLDAMVGHVDDHTPLIYVCNPNNPTGGIFRQQEWDIFLSRVANRALVVVDQAYREFVDDPEYARIEDDIRQGAPVVMVRTFSKLYGLAGMRVGWLVAAPKVVQILERVREPFSVNVVGISAAIEALKDQTYVNGVREETLILREWLRERLLQRGYRVLESQANFLTFDPKMDPLTVAQRLEQLGIIVRPTTSFGLDGHCRVTIAPRPLLERFLEALDRVVLEGPDS